MSPTLLRDYAVFSPNWMFVFCYPICFSRLLSELTHCVFATEEMARQAGMAAFTLLQPIHGCSKKLSATFLRPLAVGILGLQTSSNSSKQLASGSARSAPTVRAQLLKLVEDIYRYNSSFTGICCRLQCRKTHNDVSVSFIRRSGLRGNERCSYLYPILQLCLREQGCNFGIGKAYCPQGSRQS